MIQDENINENIEENVEGALAVCKKEKQEYLELSQRLKADFINLKKDAERQMASIKDFANEELISEILPIFDSFDLALKYVPAELKENNWVKGIFVIKSQFENILKSLGVSEIQCAGKKFDPSLHEAVSEEESDKEEDIILEEVQKGYMINGKVLRVSKVKLAKKIKNDES